MTYTPIIGLEVHVELKTKSKMFCGCSVEYFGKEPNTHTCPVCLGLPGALPVPNRTAIEWCIMIAQALNCEINTFSKFDRKNYFYPDLSKGFQISQYDLPFGKNGSITLKSGRKIGITRVHMEEDTGKLTHQDVDGVKTSLIDFNRAGLPLVEVVTEPDFHSSEDVTEYLQSLQQIVRYLDVSNADMEKGDMRLEPNISLQKEGDTSLPPYKVEVKNINSFRFVAKAIEFELVRQKEILESGTIPTQETRGWSEAKNETYSQRIKEEANDYRYFPEPDIPPIIHSDEAISSILSKVPELSEKRSDRFMSEYSLTQYDAEILTRDRSLADYFEDTVSLGSTENITPKQIANMIINQKVNHTSTSQSELIEKISSENKVDVLDETELATIINKVLSENEKAVTDYKSGKESVIMFLVGQCMRLIGRKVDTQIVKSALESTLQK
ncbi:MAG: Asp-tRNA(Asn)/Glu-tRNA(Gln) amidotransferase subunit GatB [Candidatus Levybacteria bacterium]|nr:Asp-tRNA(Asn)/Glu-tRNA(Gln) amidotransferase subunit GatB [Candidatus Levybacteria bacterium]